MARARNRQACGQGGVLLPVDFPEANENEQSTDVENLPPREDQGKVRDLIGKDAGVLKTVETTQPFTAAKIRLAMKKHAFLRERAEKRMKSGGYNCKGSVKHPRADLPQGQEEEGRVRDLIGKALSLRKIYHNEKIKEDKSAT